jgi:hypothetical protein
VKLFIGGHFWDNFDDDIRMAKQLGYGVLFENGADISVEWTK